MLGSHGETLVVDWGLAKLLSNKAHERRKAIDTTPTEISPVRLRNSGNSSETQYGSFSGTIAYAPPEQLLGQLDRMCPGTDVYSLGAILFEILTNRPPIHRKPKSLAEVVELIRIGDDLNPRVLVPAIPRALAMICLRALAFQLENRYSSAKDLAADVERWLINQSGGAPLCGNPRLPSTTRTGSIAVVVDNRFFRTSVEWGLRRTFRTA